MSVLILTKSKIGSYANFCHARILRVQGFYFFLLLYFFTLQIQFSPTTGSPATRQGRYSWFKSKTSNQFFFHNYHEIGTRTRFLWNRLFFSQWQRQTAGLKEGMMSFFGSKRTSRFAKKSLLAEDFFSRCGFLNESADKELQVTRVLDLSKYEEVGEYLEGQW